MDELKWRGLGMSSLTFENHRNAEGNICYSMYVHLYVLHDLVLKICKT